VVGLGPLVDFRLVIDDDAGEVALEGESPDALQSPLEFGLGNLV